ncbi:Transglycosylase associated protein [Minicystis rosea]|nr:Transglycosylase associated protein [Minicystis rosea]
MSILAWIFLGLISGFIASKLVDSTGRGVLMDILLGIAGAFIGGWLFTALGSHGVTGFNLWSMFVSVIGASMFLIIHHALFRRV